ncbi:MAG: hypothetical protein C5B51_11130 [Terriglobia bacterium]|nr:MAG: hypothetical protein C5B51_11130 [Terriglobia bacterium]
MCIALSGAAQNNQSRSSGDWLTWGGDEHRAGWAKSEAILSKENVSRLGIQWIAQLDTVPKFEVLSTLTAPIVIEGVTTPQGLKDIVFVIGSNDTVNAIDAESGAILWKRNFPNNLKPPASATYLCPNTQNATPVIDKETGIIYLNTSDGKLRGLSVSNGEDRMPATDFLTPFARNWSLNLVDGVIYTPVARGCGNAVSNFAAMDIRNPAHPQVHYFTGTGRPAGAWGRGGMIRGPKGMYAQTADGPYDPAAGKFGNTVLALNPRDLRLIDSFTPANFGALNEKDLDLGSASPIIFPFQKWNLLATSSKEAVIHILDANALGGADHHTPLHQSRWGNDIASKTSKGLWGSMATWEDGQGQRWLLLPMWGPPSKNAPAFQYSYGPAEEGSVMAFRLTVENEKPSLVPVWMSRDMHVPDVPAVANGVVFVLSTGENTLQGGYFPPEVRAKPYSHAIFYALDAANGNELYSSGDQIPSFAHFAGLAISKGRIYFCTWDAKVYSFGLKAAS